MNELLAGGRALADRGDLVAAADRFAQALRLAPGSTAILHDLGIVRFRQGRLADAERCFRGVVERAADSVDGHTALGTVLEARGCLADAHTCFLRAVELDPGSADAHANLAAVLHASGRLDDAAAAYRAALERRPDHPRALTGLAVLLDLAGRYSEGLELLARASCASAELALARARLLGHAGRGAEALGELRSLLAWPALPRTAERHARYALAGLLDGAGRFAEAFAEAARASAIDPPSFDRAACRDFVARAQQRFSHAAVGRLPRATTHSERPVFIVGMPRSGTTLVEQILAGHPEVHGAGERNDMLWLTEELGQRAGGDYLDALDALDAVALDDLAGRYLAGLQARPERRVTDKMPVNFRHLGLIALMLPGARVIHCRRDPLDTALSCFMHDFSGPELAFASRLDDIAAYYSAYRELIGHWRQTLELRMIEVDYEALVGDLDAQARRLVEFLGLTWDARCLRFDELARTVNTASQSQVRRPLFTSAVGRRHRYTRELAPLASAWAAEPWWDGDPGCANRSEGPGR